MATTRGGVHPFVPCGPDFPAHDSEQRKEIYLDKMFFSVKSIRGKSTNNYPGLREEQRSIFQVKDVLKFGSSLKAQITQFTS